MIKGLGRGGAEMLLVEGLRYTRAAGCEIGFGYFLPWKDALVPALREQGAVVTCFDCRSNLAILRSARRVAYYAKQWNADLIHCHLPVAGLVGRLAGRLADIPVVYTEHNKWERYHPVTRWANRLTWGLQDRVIAVSADVASSIRKHTRSSAPVDVVLNGVNTGRFDRTTVDARGVRRSLGIPDTSPVVGTVAVFRVQKRLPEWLDAARLIRERLPDTRFVIAGDGPERPAVEAAIRRHGLDGAVHLVGLQEDVRPFVAAMDVFMISSEFEGLPVAMLEAMSLERAVVATPVGGIPEAISDGRNGVVIEDLEPSSLAAAAVRLLESRELRERLGSEARRTVEARFSMRRMVTELEQIYTRVLQDRAAGALARPRRPRDPLATIREHEPHRRTEARRGRTVPKVEVPDV